MHRVLCKRKGKGAHIEEGIRLCSAFVKTTDRWGVQDVGSRVLTSEAVGTWLWCQRC